MVIAEGPSAIFKFSLAILLSKKDDMMKLEGFETVADYIKNHLNDIDDTLIRHLVATASHIELNGSLDTYATEYSVLSENDLLREPGQNWSPSKDIVRDLRVQNRKLKEQVSIQDTQIQALQDSLREIEDQATRQKETTKKLSELEIERDDLKELVSKLSEQLGNLSAEQNTFNSRNSTPC
jgi:predicted  nucleic acid-binding Zn-ribbon protein